MRFRSRQGPSLTDRFTLPNELRPSDFAARLGRGRARAIGSARQRRHRGRRALAVLAAIAVPAFAAPGEWSTFQIGDAGTGQAAIQPMPFEQPGSSFPGSAFYYLAAEDQAQYWTDADLPPVVEGIHSDANDGAPGPLPAARPLRIDNSGVDRSRALQCLTAAIYYEARSEADAGQRAVAQVVLNRVAHPSYPGTVCGVVYQGSERRTGCQFSFTCDGSLAKAPQRLFWQRAEDVARAALSGFVYTPVGLATHYHTIAIHPYWAPSLAHVGTIGAHRFYRFGGKAGQPGAFRFAYAGGEPLAAPHARAAGAPIGEDASLDPLAVQRAFEAGFKASQTGALTTTSAGTTAVRAAPPPVYSAELQARGGEALHRADKLPQSGEILPQYANSGQWIARPGT